MDNTKPWWQSRTIWASILTMIGGVGVAFGLFDQGTADLIGAEGPDLLVGLAGAVLGLISLWGRMRATKRIEPSADA